MLISLNSLITEKNNKTNIIVGAKKELKWNKLECEEHGHNVRNTVTKTNSWFLKVKKIQVKNKKNETFYFSAFET